MKKIFYFLLFLISFIACEKHDLLTSTPNNEDVLEGPIDGLTTAELSQFGKGDAAFDEVFTTEKGLGPIFVASSCGNCHVGDGKGTLITAITRFGQSDISGNQYLHLGGPQLQNRAIPGYSPEQIPVGASSSKFVPPAVSGLGYLSLVSDADILSMSDENDSNGDGISGVPNWISLPNYITPFANSISQNGLYIGRFGKKASSFNLLHQIVNAYKEDIGIASVFEPYDVFQNAIIDPEIPTQTINNVLFYMMTLKAPIQRNTNDVEVLKGKEIFNQINCSGCHVPVLKTGNSSIQSLSNKEFYPYTDLLLHDLGENLNDNYTEGNALTSEWRTRPLWGLGLSMNSQGGQYYLMHDGRAKSIEEAINLHGGEASDVRNSYLNLSDTDKAAMLKFLKSL